jgi:DNA polymerase III epsilon subunit-like protein
MEMTPNPSKNPFDDELRSYISVDVETSGPNPSQYSLLSIGACTLIEPQQTFYVEIQPVNDSFVPQALAVSGLSMDRLAESGLPPRQAMDRFESWLKATLPPEIRPIFVGFNAPFDWMFINDYFHRFLEHNPFGHKALDLKAFYMALKKVTWKQTSLHDVALDYQVPPSLTHNALQDAIDQAAIFKKMLDEISSQE